MNRHERRKLKVIASRQAVETAARRPCGECTACCWTMGVEPLKKEMYQTCVYVFEARNNPTPIVGCQIYPTRPRCCATFNCVWKYGLGLEDADRPDRSGVVLIPAPDPDNADPLNAAPFLIAHPAWPDSLTLEPARKLIGKLVTLGHAIVSDDGNGLVQIDAPHDKYAGVERRLKSLPTFTAGPLGRST